MNDHDKQETVDIARDFSELGFGLMATAGTCRHLQQNGLKVGQVSKKGEPRPDIADAISNGEVQLIVNTPLGPKSRQDEHSIGLEALQHKVPMVTTLSAAKAMVRAIRRVQTGRFEVRSLQEIFQTVTA